MIVTTTCTPKEKSQLLAFSICGSPLALFPEEKKTGGNIEGRPLEFMEYNRDEAIRAKRLAEKKLADKDFANAKKYTLKAETLYPDLDGISQLSTIIDVYISAENKVSGESDWYGILGVNPCADDETIRKQYRKLALMLHPDKNKSIGADGAFKLISEAWSLLSDKAKRLTYNQRRNSRSFDQKLPSQSWAPSATPGVNSKPKSRRTTTSTVQDQSPRADTFWTVCHRCKMQYEYLKVYLNQTLLCPNCQEPFLAKQSAPPLNFHKTVHSSSHQQHHDSSNIQYNSGKTDIRSSKDTNSFWGPFPGTDACNTDPSIASKAANVIQRVNERLKREREELSAGLPSKFRKVDSSDSELPSFNTQYQTTMGNGSGHTRTTGFETNGVYGFFNNNSTRELTPLETRNMLIKKAQKVIRRKVNEWLSEVEENKKLPANNFNSTNKVLHQTVDMQEPAMSVPDPDFHNFDSDRTENSFQDYQVWSAYDDDDGMPRFYALIHKVLSRKPLKMKISWLNSKTTAEFGKMEWIGSGFRKTCGEFRVGKFQINESLNSFSQKVKFTRTPRGSVVIHPKKGDVWALYRNWSRDWNECVPDHVIHQYDMVEVVDDYNEEQGVSVRPLVKLTGFRTVFCPHTDKPEVKKIPKEEMLRFSHQVPKYLLTGKEGRNSPKGYLELDPAATPLELIQKTT